MHVNDIPAYEAAFDADGIDAHGKLHHVTNQQIPIPGEATTLFYKHVEPASGDESFYYRSEFTKEQIVLHYTLGYLKGDVATLTRHDYHVSVPFLIGRNGTIYNLFPSYYWAYHLGPGAVGGNRTRSRASIAIELSNIGGLTPSPEGFRTYYTDVYCDTHQTPHVEANPFRRFTHYATFTDAQYESLTTLLRYLTARYGIPRTFLPESDRYETHSDIVDFRGIVSHVNYRSSGKEDIGPAFDWDRVAAGIA